MILFLVTHLLFPKTLHVCNRPPTLFISLCCSTFSRRLSIFYDICSFSKLHRSTLPSLFRSRSALLASFFIFPMHGDQRTLSISIVPGSLHPFDFFHLIHSKTLLLSVPDILDYFCISKKAWFYFLCEYLCSWCPLYFFCFPFFLSIFMFKFLLFSTQFLSSRSRIFLFCITTYDESKPSLFIYFSSDLVQILVVGLKSNMMQW